MKVRAIASTALLLFALPGAAQVYRCEVDGVPAFSDRPCGPDAALHRGGGGISFVTPDESLPELAAAARQFIDRRREQLAARRERERQRRQPPAPQASTPPPQQVVFVPWPEQRGGQHRFPDHRRRGRHDGRDRPVIADNDRYSPLNGPILGTRPESAAFSSRRGGDRSKPRSDRRP